MEHKSESTARNDAADECWARGCRERSGACGRLVSWQPLAGGRWLARLSHFGDGATVEARGGTRRAAIAAAQSLLAAADAEAAKRSRSRLDDRRCDGERGGAARR